MFDVILNELPDLVPTGNFAGLDLAADPAGLDAAEIAGHVLAAHTGGADANTGEPAVTDGPDMDGDGDRDWFDEKLEEHSSDTLRDTWISNHVITASQEWEQGQRINQGWDDFWAGLREGFESAEEWLEEKYDEWFNNSGGSGDNDNDEDDMQNGEG
ncbi:hypothetical protein KCG44_06755 [Pacificimonas sp. WHA3]|uniref:Uncharacterized protein n=1 Tax=Pacificimonas pallii TaxID=2827236 RepID=A0ABS6SE09_9SPHN|nr:hypothetical protein [Pacificimonas pallii]MBV7256485.1 hypothetical protein [Pacificimonas pallii]